MATRNDFPPFRDFLYPKYVFERVLLHWRRELNGLTDYQKQLCEDLAKRKPWSGIGPYLMKCNLLIRMTRMLGVPFDESMFLDVIKTAEEALEEGYQPELAARNLLDEEQELVWGELYSQLTMRRRQSAQESEDEWDETEDDETDSDW